jgi:hypothetical protein
MKIEVLKTLVIVLGVACAVALAAVIYGIVGLAVRPEEPATRAAAMETLLLAQPAGTAIVSVAALDGNNLAVALTGGGAPERVVVIDATTGAIVRTIVVAPAP